MEEEKRGKPQKKIVLISIAAGLAAMVIFIAAYYMISFRRKTVVYDGEGKYSAIMSTDAGISSEYSGLDIALESDGSCTVILGEKSEKGGWSRTGDRIEISLGRHRYSGTIEGDKLELTDNGSSSVIITLKKNIDKPDLTEIPVGNWKILSVTDGFTVYSDDMLKKIGYDGTYLKIDEDGRGTADILNGGESDIKVEGEYISYKGMKLKYTFSEGQLSVSYSDDVALIFGK